MLSFSQIAKRGKTKIEIERKGTVHFGTRDNMNVIIDYRYTSLSIIIHRFTLLNIVNCTMSKSFYYFSMVLLVTPVMFLPVHKRQSLIGRQFSGSGPEHELIIAE